MKNKVKLFGAILIVALVGLALTACPPPGDEEIIDICVDCGELEEDCTCCERCGKVECECPDNEINIRFVIKDNKLELNADNSVLSLAAGDEIIITGEGDFDRFDIYADGVCINDGIEDEIDFSISANELHYIATDILGYSGDDAFGLYKIMIVVWKNNIPYSSEISVELKP